MDAVSADIGPGMAARAITGPDSLGRPHRDTPGDVERVRPDTTDEQHSSATALRPGRARTGRRVHVTNDKRLGTHRESALAEKADEQGNRATQSSHATVTYVRLCLLVAT